VGFAGVAFVVLFGFDMNIVLTGASGRIGRAIHVRLSPYHSIIGVDISPSSTADVVGDITDSQLLRRLFRGVDAVIHTAALHAPHVGILPDAEFERINVEATQRVIDAALASNVQRIIFTSTTALYGASARVSESAIWIDEQTEPQPLTIYHRTKLAAEAVLHSAALGGGLKVRILRMSRCFPESAPQMAVYRLHRGIDARDVADAHAYALEHDEHELYCTFIISGTTPFLREDTALLLHDARFVLERRVPEFVRDFTKRGWPLPASIDRVYDSTHTHIQLGWKPRFGYQEVLLLLEQGLAEVLPPYRQPISK
jgi:nucleoside-diphosphate-sugar epimerase